MTYPWNRDIFGLITDPRYCVTTFPVQKSDNNRNICSDTRTQNTIYILRLFVGMVFHKDRCLRTRTLIFNIQHFPPFDIQYVHFLLIGQSLKTIVEYKPYICEGYC